MAEFRRLGLIVNPHAGLGRERNLAVARAAIEALRPTTVYTGPGALGAAALADWPDEVVVESAGSEIGRTGTQHLAVNVAQRRPDALVVIGGDGTLADVVEGCLDHVALPPLIGIGVGSTNVGRLMTCAPEEVPALRSLDLSPVVVGAIVVSHDGARAGLAFNDAVIGFTVVGTVDRRRRDLDAAARMRGEAIPGSPRSIGTDRTEVTQWRSGDQRLVARGEQVGGVAVGFTEPAFFGKAVTGGICVATVAGLPAGCLVSDRPIVRIEVDPEIVVTDQPLECRFVGVDDRTRIVVRGVQEGAVLCADGNPVRLLSEDDVAEFSLLPGVASVYRLGGRGGAR